MKQLASNYSKNGYDFNLVSRNGDVAIYSQHDKETGQLLYYEVFIVQKNKERTIAGNIIPASESSPANEQWGSEGYTMTDLTSARSKEQILHQIVDRRKNRLTQGQ